MARRQVVKLRWVEAKKARNVASSVRGSAVLLEMARQLSGYDITVAMEAYEAFLRDHTQQRRRPGDIGREIRAAEINQVIRDLRSGRRQDFHDLSGEVVAGVKEVLARREKLLVEAIELLEQMDAVVPDGEPMCPC
ncbi:hypothetical protein ACP4OV_016489 [Aristida adscensionis]